jgi:outer membrane protein
MILRYSLVSVAILLLSLLPATAAKPKVAVVDAQRAFTEYYATKNAHKKLALAKLALQNDKRLPVIAATEKELQELRTKVRDTTLSEAQREQAFKESEMKAHELRSLQRDTKQFMEGEQQKMNKLLVSVTRKLQVNVQTVITQIAKAGNFELVFESGGNTSSQVPTLIYIREAVDITDVVIDHLNSTDPAPEPEDDQDLILPPALDNAPPGSNKLPARPIE